MWGNDAVQAYTSNLSLFSYCCDAYLLITTKKQYMIANYILLQLVMRKLSHIAGLSHAGANNLWSINKYARLE